MSWTLEIHHIDVGGVGDSTLIVARYPKAGGQPEINQAVLIDGGRTKNAAKAVMAYVTGVTHVQSVHAIVVTHFDEDHVSGITHLLKQPLGKFTNAIVYDCGVLPDYRKTKNRRNDPDKPRTIYSEYRKAVAAAAVTHATALVNSYHIVQYDGNDMPTLPTAANAGIPARYLSPDVLLGKDVLWGNGILAAGWAETRNAHAPGQPTLRCLSVNKWIRQAGGNPPVFITKQNIYDGPPPRMGDAKIAELESDKDGDNAKSIGFLLEFGRFRYYLAGDLEKMQENGAYAVHVTPPQFLPGVQAFLNPLGDITGRVQAMKTSHHGSDSASSPEFLRAMRPGAAVISNGKDNKFGHPAARVINVLDGYVAIPALGGKWERRPASQIPPLRRPIPHYLTGWTTRGNNHVPPPAFPPSRTLGGVASETAGPDSGSVLLTVTEQQAARDPNGRCFRGVLAAATRTSDATNQKPGAALLTAIANDAAMDGFVAACGRVVGAVNAAPAIVTAVDQCCDGFDAMDNPVGGLVPAGMAARPAQPAVAIAAVQAVPGGRAAAVGPGTAAVIGATVAGGSEADIRAAATAAVPPASAPAAAAAGVVGEYVRTNVGPAAAGYAAVAALVAVTLGGATSAGGAAIGAAVGAVSSPAATAATVATAVTTVGIAAGLTAQIAARAGAVAGAAAFGGTPAAAGDATTAALRVAGYPADVAGPAATADVGAVGDLFTVEVSRGAASLKTLCSHFD